MSDLEQTDAYQPSEAGADPSAGLPSHIGRYRVERILGQGGFGIVYLAHDEQLQRLVAVKIPHRDRVTTSEDIEACLTEARAVANLDHPSIVPVHDVGSSADCPCFIVSKFIDGTDLATSLKRSRLSIRAAAELVATVAEALHCAHRQGLVHRDIKPANILVEKSGKPFVADFGLALREQDVGKGPRAAGTPAYMSPEQARGEGHRVDGRSDIFSLGVVFYELLTGRLPFRGESRNELLEHIRILEARPPRQIDDAIPKELDRICLKALSKRASDRYSAARDMADDLRDFISTAPAAERTTIEGTRNGEADAPTAVPNRTPAGGSSQFECIVPKGLRSFDATDADFFLELLPGPRDRDGLPDSIRFWKTRIEATNPDASFSVGLIYGPSGCGKSSLVKAGLMPRLAKSVAAIYVEATGEQTESRLLKGLRRHFSELPESLSLIDSLSALRRGRFLQPDQRVLLVLDQFEQWLHARSMGESLELVQALRHCDGARLHCLLMVRDDFWLAVSRFMKALEVEILEGRNSSLVDLFDPIHARKVLAAFGRAYGRLPDNLGQCTSDQVAFLTQGVSDLAQDGKIVSVRLALFAEMVKGKQWNPAALRELGGAEGVGATFLEETFAAATAPPHHRLHARAAQAVLKALLPAAGADIKGHMRARDELLEASGYHGRPDEFDALIQILDAEIRLITPTDPEGNADAEIAAMKLDGKYYQLTHDYLVPSLRAWLTRKQKETRRGRAELLLADCAAVWNSRPENRQLPSLRQWLSVRCLTNKRQWTPPQRRMMTKAAKYHAVRGASLVVLVVAVACVALTIRTKVNERDKMTRAAGLVDEVVHADIRQVPTVISAMADYRFRADPRLRDEFKEAAEGSPQKLRASLALLPGDAKQVDYLFGRLLDASPSEVLVIRDALAPYEEDLQEKLWTVVAKPEKDKESQRLRAAAALAKYDTQNARWRTVGPLVVNDLVRENLLLLGQWSELFRPVKDAFLPALTDVFRDQLSEHATMRSLATNLLSEFAADNPPRLAELVLDADEKQFAAIFPLLKDNPERGLPVLIGEIDKKLPANLPSSDPGRENLAKRQANAAVALLRLNQPAKVWPLLRRNPPDDPRVRSYLIHRLAALRADAGEIVKRLEVEPDIVIRRALTLGLGEFSDRELTPDVRGPLVSKLQAVYATDTDPGLHAAAEWLLRTWKQEEWLRKVNQEWADKKTKADNWWVDEKVHAAQVSDSAAHANRGQPAPAPRWFVNRQGQTMVVIPGPVEFLMGSPSTEAGRQSYETQHKMRIGRSFAISAKSVTVEEYRKFDKVYAMPSHYDRAPELPVLGIDWYRAAQYCNWLSKEEGIAEEQWCYVFTPKEVRLKTKYLSLAGYRLPTEAEMEYAMRAGSITSRHYGESEELLSKYARYQKNSQELSWPIGSLKPNDFGLFEVPGNVFTWCQERYFPYPPSGEARDDKEDEDFAVAMTVLRSMRGGWFGYPASSVRSAYRDYNMPSLRNALVGCRPARTLPPLPAAGSPPAVKRDGK